MVTLLNAASAPCERLLRTPLDTEDRHGSSNSNLPCRISPQLRAATCLEGFVQSFVGHQIKQNAEQNKHYIITITTLRHLRLTWRRRLSAVY